MLESASPGEAQAVVHGMEGFEVTVEVLVQLSLILDRFRISLLMWMGKFCNEEYLEPDWPLAI